MRPRPGPAAVELAEGKLAVILGCSAGLDDGLGGRCVLLPCLRRSEIGPACFARDEQRSALCQIHGRRRTRTLRWWEVVAGGEALCCEA